MKKIAAAVVALSLIASVQAREEISDVARNTDNLYRTGAGAQDGAYTAISTSMFVGWGVGLAVGIALLAAALNKNSSSSSSSHAHSH